MLPVSSRVDSVVEDERSTVPLSSSLLLVSGHDATTNYSCHIVLGPSRFQ